MNDLSNDQDFVEVDDSKTNNNEISSVQYHIKPCNDSNYIQLIITEDIADYVLLYLQSK